jgi:hypothetical protein
MGSFPVDDSQLALYLAFTFLSLAVSIAVYCLYFHGFKFADSDYARHVRFYAKVSAPTASERDEGRGSVEAPLIE